MIITPSATKHRVPADDIEHAYAHALIGHEEEEGMVIIVGPAGDGTLIEVGYAVSRRRHGGGDPRHAPSPPQVSKVTMARRSTQQIIDQAEALTLRFEQAEPSPAGGKDAAPLHAVRDAFTAVGMADRELVDAVADARAAGFSWALIGSMMGVSRRRRPATIRSPSGRPPPGRLNGMMSSPCR